MGTPYRRIDPDSRAVIVKDEGGNVVKTYDIDGNLVSFPMVTDGSAALKVSDISSAELLREVVEQLKIINFHLQILTDEDMKEVIE